MQCSDQRVLGNCLWCVFLHQQMCALVRMVHEEMPQLSFWLRLLEICLQK